VARGSEQLPKNLKNRFLDSLARYLKGVKGEMHFEGGVLTSRASAERFYQAEKEVPQPQVPVALGLVNLKPPP
jgi:hypothetical protein